jgi:glycosyltransferase involved in cell wall biosynthesis
LLRECLTAINTLECPAGYEIISIVVDNDVNKSAMTLCSDWPQSSARPLLYFVHPERGLSSVRNRLLDEAIKVRAELIAFIDDDEQPDTGWLNRHVENLQKHAADVSTGPVRQLLDGGGMTEGKEKATGSQPRHVSTNNVVFKSLLVTEQALRFDPFFNFIGGEDFDFFERSLKNGNIHVWSHEARVLESIPPERNSMRYLFHRHFSGGINNVLRFKRSRSSWHAWPRYLLKFLGKLLGAVFCLFGSAIRADKTMLRNAVKKIASGLGYLAGLLNIVVERYRNIEFQDEDTAHAND